MKVVLFGGGGLRSLPLARCMLQEVPDLRAGEIVIYDLDGARAEAMALMVGKSPEFQQAEAEVSWTNCLDEALPGADLVSFSLMAGSPESFQLSQVACDRHGFMGSDQISPSGAFLALKGGKIALECARAMERHCPQAWLLFRANPVPVLSAVVNNHTSVRALGICDGFTNHMFDLPRLMGRDEMDTGFEVDVAGINHGSLILRGTYRGEALWTVLQRYLGPGWEPPEFRVNHDPLRQHAHSPGQTYTEVQAAWLNFALHHMVDMYRKHGVTVFSNEGDGTGHLRYEEQMEWGKQFHQSPTEEEIREGVRRHRESRAQSDREFQELAHGELPAEYFQPISPWEREQITVRIARALGGDGPQRIVTSFPSRGGVEGFKDRTVLEYSQWLGPEGLRPTGNLFVPDVYHGMITALAMHQTLLGDAIATEDPRILYEALWTYPIRQGSAAQMALWRDLLEINREDLSPAFQGTLQYLD